MSQKRLLVSLETQLLMIIQLALVTVGFTCGPDNCTGVTKTCEIKIYCNYSSYNNACICTYYDVNTSKMVPCDTSSNPSCWYMPTTDVSCADSITFLTCTTNNGYMELHISCNDCTSTSTEYTVRCFCNNFYTWSTDYCQFCNVSSTTATSSSTSFPPTGIIHTSLTTNLHGSSSAKSIIKLAASSHSSLTGSLTITSKPSLITPFISPSIVAQANTIVLAIAGVIPTVCILALGVFGLVMVLFVILYQRRIKRMPVNQRGRTDTLQQMDNIYHAYVHTPQNSHEVIDEGEAPPNYSMITMENFGTNGAHANTSSSTAAHVPYIEADYNTLVHMNRREIMDNTQQDSNNYSTLSNNTGVATVTNQSAYEHVRDSHDPDYFDDPHVLQQIRAHKE